MRSAERKIGDQKLRFSRINCFQLRALGVIVMGDGIDLDAEKVCFSGFGGEAQSRAKFRATFKAGLPIRADTMIAGRYGKK